MIVAFFLTVVAAALGSFFPNKRRVGSVGCFKTLESYMRYYLRIEARQCFWTIVFSIDKQYVEKWDPLFSNWRGYVWMWLCLQWTMENGEQSFIGTMSVCTIDKHCLTKWNEEKPTIEDSALFLQSKCIVSLWIGLRLGLCFCLFFKIWSSELNPSL